MCSNDPTVCVLRCCVFYKELFLSNNEFNLIGYFRLSWPVRALHFSHDGALLAAASEDLYIDVSEVSTGARVFDIPVETPTFTVAWHPKRYILAYACDDKEAYDRKKDVGTLKLFGFGS